MFAGFAVAPFPAAAQLDRNFVFTAIPDQDETRLIERFTRIAEYLQRSLGLPVRYLPVKSYPASVTAFTNNQVQLAWFGGFTGVQARRAVPGSEAIAQGAEDLPSAPISSPTRAPVCKRRRSCPRRSLAGPSPSAPAPRPPAG